MLQFDSKPKGAAERPSLSRIFKIDSLYNIDGFS
jgi:hypothetical protein